jgi:hypothetical protein
MAQQRMKYQQTAIVDASPETPTYREIKPESYLISLRRVITLFMSAGISLIVLIGFLTGMIGAWHDYIRTWGWVWQVLIWVLGGGVPAAVGILLIAYGVRAWFWMAREHEDIKAAKDERNRLNRQNDAEFAYKMAEAQRIMAEAEKIRRTIDFDAVGNAAIVNPETWQIAQLRGNYQETPNLHSISQSYRNDNQIQPGAQQALPEAGQAPTFEECLNRVETNSLNFCIGKSLSTSEYTMVDLKRTHLLLIGTTQKGKSTQSASIMEMLVKKHNPTHAQLALLDLEDLTCNLFAQEPHVLTLNRNGKRIKAIARSAQEVAVYLGYLVDEMDARYQLAPKEREKLPHVLIYIEEFLDLKRRIRDEKTRKDMADAFTQLAIRGLKANMHLMVCAQASYSEDDFREAMAQLTGTLMAFCAPPRLAQSAGFMNYDLLKKNFLAKQPGQFVLEGTGQTDLCTAPQYDLKAKLKAFQDAEESRLSSGQTFVSEVQDEVPAVQEHPHLIPLASSFAPYQHPTRTSVAHNTAPAWEGRVDVVAQLLDEGKNQDQIIEKVWKLTKGGNAKYYAARDEYRACVAAIKERRQQAYEQAAGE